MKPPPSNWQARSQAIVSFFSSSVRPRSFNPCKPHHVFITCPSLLSDAGVLLKLPLARRREFEVVDKMRRKFVQWQAQQSSTGKGADLRLKNRIAVLFVLLEVGEGFCPRANFVAKFRGVFAEPDEALHLLKIKYAMFLLQFF